MTSIDYCVYVLDLPGTVRAAVRVDCDGFASIYINAHLSYTEQQNALKHELRHLRRDDMYNLRSIRQIERSDKRCRARKNNT